MSAQAAPSLVIEDEGLSLRPWDEDLVAQMAKWQEYGFPYNAFDLGYLRDARAARVELARRRTSGPHLHFVACEGDTAVGRVSVNLRDEAGLYIWAVHVPPEYASRGICRRMLAALMRWLEARHPGPDFVLTTNTFATHAHRAYRALGFEVTGTRWHFDRELADALWKVPSEQRAPISEHLRFQDGRWEVRVYVMVRHQGAPMDTTVTPS